MPMPKFNIQPHKRDEKWGKLHDIICELHRMNYDVGDAYGVILIIEKEGVDKFDFDYPYGSFEEFKCHVLNGEFEFDENEKIMSKEKELELQRAVNDGELWITY